jgi:hypothetical protein
MCYIHSGHNSYKYQVYIMFANKDICSCGDIVIVWQQVIVKTMLWFVDILEFWCFWEVQQADRFSSLYVDDYCWWLEEENPSYVIPKFSWEQLSDSPLHVVRGGVV